MTGTRYAERVRTTANATASTYLRRPTVEPYVRPADWPLLPELQNNRIYGLVAVRNANSNFLALTVTVTGGYTVDWGDGSVENVTSGTKAQHQYTYSTLSTSVTSRGYKTALVQVYPQAANNITAIDLHVQHGSVARATETGWLDLAIQANSITTSMSIGNSNALVYVNMLEQARVVATSMTTGWTGLFYDCRRLQSVSITAGAATNLTSMFTNCSSLQVAPFFKTSSVTTFSNMFNGCSSLTSVPNYSMASTTSLLSMFAFCKAIQNVPLFDTANVTSMNSMFYECSSLVAVPNFNTGSVTTVASMFFNCTSLASVPQFNLAAITTTGLASTFSGCSSLQNIPDLTVGAVTSLSATFNGCTALRAAPNVTSTSAITTIANAFNGCASMQSIPAFNWRAVTTTTTPFSAAQSVESIAVTGMRVAFSIASCNLSATALNTLYTNLAGLGTRSCTATGDGTTMTYTTSTAHPYIAGQLVSVTGMTPTGYNVTNQVITSVPSSTTFTVAGTATGSGTGGTANGGAAATITVTGNWGTAADDPTIATNKGWTVTG